MTNNKYTSIFCDLGNVLINFDHRIAVRKILQHTYKKEEDIYQLFFDSSLTKLYEEGKITSLDFFHSIKESLGLNMDYDKFLPIWDDIFFETPLNLKMQKFLINTKKRYKLVMISNINENHYEFLKNKMPVFNEFDRIILSYEVGFRKPACEIYHAALESVNTPASRAFYIDDRADLVEAASKLGIKGIVFNDKDVFEKLKKEIKL